MKIIILFIFSFLVLLVSCSEKAAPAPAENNQTNDNEETTQKKRTSRPSAGPLAPINLGEFSYTLREVSKHVTQFKSGYNDISLTDDNITIRITDMNGTSFLIILKGADFSKGAEHDYQPILAGTNRGGHEAMVTYMSNEESIQWKSGVLKVTTLDPKSGKFVASIANGGAVNALEIASAETFPIELSVDMRFENVVNLAKGVIQ